VGEELESKKKFGEYAAMDAPNLPDDPFSRVQVVLHRARTLKFEDESRLIARLMSAGGLLADVLVVSPAARENQAEIVSALGDALITLFQLATFNRLDVGTILREACGLMKDQTAETHASEVAKKPRPAPTSIPGPGLCGECKTHTEVHHPKCSIGKLLARK
jgi:hypothetical protein